MIAEAFDITIHLQKENRVYRFSLPYGAPFAETHEVIQDLANHLKQMEEKAKEQAAAKEAEQKPVEEIVAEVQDGSIL